MNGYDAPLAQRLTAIYSKGPTSMKRGISLNIGVKMFDLEKIPGYSSDSELNASEFDARDMHDIATTAGFEAKLLLGPAATGSEVRDRIQDAANRLDAGDIFMLTFSGHGESQIDDNNHDEEFDQYWFLYDELFSDDELDALWHNFRAGVRILMISDSCHSGTMYQMKKQLNGHSNPAESSPLFGWYHELDKTPQLCSGLKKIKMPRPLPTSTGSTREKMAALRTNMVKRAREKSPKGDVGDIQANLIYLSACADNQLADDGVRNSLFTGTLRQVWQNGAFAKDYRAFHAAILKAMPPYQSPGYATLGPNPLAFEQQRPFTI